MTAFSVYILPGADVKRGTAYQFNVVLRAQQGKHILEVLLEVTCNEQTTHFPQLLTSVFHSDMHQELHTDIN